MKYNTATSLPEIQHDFSDPSTISSLGNSFNVSSLVPAIILSAIVTAIPVSLSSNQYSDLAVSYKKDVINVPKTKDDYKAETIISANDDRKESIIAFSHELYKRSRSMTDEEYFLVKNMFFSIANPGLPEF